ncbi:MAG: ABC transporter substrate-binding protein, partial [Desertimonas sp.]
SQSLNDDVRYERFDDYWDVSRKPNFQHLTFKIVPDESSRVAGVRTGDLDIAFGLSAAAVGEFEGAADFTVVETPESALAYCHALDNVFPDEDGPLKSLDVRKALLMAIDRDGIAASLYGGYAQTPNSPVPSVMLGYDPDVEPLPYDPDEARALLEGAGHAGMSVTLHSYNATSSVPDIQKLAETVATLWRQIGVETTLNLADAGTILPAWRSRQLHGAGLLAGPVYFYQEPSRLTSSFFSTDASYSTVSDPDLDALAADIVQETDADAREELGRQLADLLNAQLYGLPLLTVSSLSVTGRNVASWTTITGCPYASVAWLRAV